MVSIKVLSVCVCVRIQIPASEVRWPGTDGDPLGESLLDVGPQLPLPLPRLFLLAAEWLRGGGSEWGDEQSTVPSVSHKLGSGRSHGTLLGWAEGRREKAAVRCFSRTPPPAHLWVLYPLSSSPRLSLASVMLLFFSFFSFLLPGLSFCINMDEIKKKALWMCHYQSGASSCGL